MIKINFICLFILYLKETTRKAKIIHMICIIFPLVNASLDHDIC